MWERNDSVMNIYGLIKLSLKNFFKRGFFDYFDVVLIFFKLMCEYFWFSSR